MTFILVRKNLIFYYLLIANLTYDLLFILGSKILYSIF